ncbi:MAG: hypothetical protein JHC33_12745 [Ignisphaera sp.]|nr:hypothetical protein [Ignisphaera sp.]
MLVSDVLNSVAYGDIYNLSLGEAFRNKSNNAASTNAINTLINYLNLAITELSTRFNLKTSVITLPTYEGIRVYTIRDPNLVKVLEVFDDFGVPLAFPNTIDDLNSFDIKEISFNTFLVNNPVNDSHLNFVCKTLLPEVTNMSEDIAISRVFLEPLCSYIAYKAFSSLGGPNNQKASDSCFLRFENSCAKLVERGFTNNPESLFKNIYNKGFV